MCFSIGRTLPWLHCSKLILSRSFWLFHGQKDVQAVSFWEIQVRWQVFPSRELTYHTYPLWKTFPRWCSFSPGWDMLLPWTFWHIYVFLCWPGECELLQFCRGSIEKLGHVLGVDSSKFNMFFLTLKIEIWEKRGDFPGFNYEDFWFPILDFRGWIFGNQTLLIFFSDCWPDGSPVFFSLTGVGDWWCCWLLTPNLKDHIHEQSQTPKAKWLQQNI